MLYENEQTWTNMDVNGCVLFYISNIILPILPKLSFTPFRV